MENSIKISRVILDNYECPEGARAYDRLTRANELDGEHWAYVYIYILE